MPDYTFPVVFDGARISSGAGRRNAPLPGASTNHKGIDIAAPTGSPVVAPTGLNITYAGQARGYGNVIYGVDEQGFQHRFAHLDGFNVQSGQTLPQGYQIGTVGSTGNSTGPHLHYEIRDAKGNFLRGATERVVAGGKRLETAAKDAALDALDKGLESVPIIGGIWSGAKALGVPNIFDASKGECGLNPVCHLKNWLDETQYLERSALIIVGIVLIVGAIVFLALGYNPKNLAQKALSKVAA